MNIDTRGYKFFEAMSFDAFPKDTVDAVPIEEFRPIVESYLRNMNRVAAMPYLVADVAYWSTLSGRAVGWIPLTSGVPHGDLLAKCDVKSSSEYHFRMSEAEAELLAQGMPHAAKEISKIGSEMIEYLSANTADDDSIRAGIEAVLYTMILNSYAAFESLATDLWVTAVNLNPSIYKIEEYEGDLSNHTGDLLRDAKRMNFQSLGGIKEAFSQLSNKGCNVFKFNPDLMKVEKTRHLIAHRSGKVDKQFLGQCKNWEEFEHAVEGEYLVIDGLLVSKLINVCVKAAGELMEFVIASCSTSED